LYYWGKSAKEFAAKAENFYLKNFLKLNYYKY